MSAHAGWTVMSAHAGWVVMSAHAGWTVMSAHAGFVVICWVVRFTRPLAHLPIGSLIGNKKQGGALRL